MVTPRKAVRDNNFDLLRVILASMVILGHAYEMAWNNRSHEPLSVLTGTTESLGDMAVAGFFVLSGFLILQSWLHAPRAWVYARKRMLRILPGYFVAALLSTVIVGLAAPPSVAFFHNFTWRYPVSLLMLDSPAPPTVFPGMFWGCVDGSLWTIKYEFRCYILVALLGMAGLFRNRMPMLVLAAGTLALAFVPPLHNHMLWHHWEMVLGDPNPLYALTSAFLCGGCYYLFWKEIPRKSWIALLALAAMLPLLFHQLTVEPALIVFGGYLLLYVAFVPIRALDFYKTAPDLSYGIYLYGWPVEVLLTWYLHPAPLVTFFCTMAITVPLAWLSWKLVERPALLLKPKGSVPLPDSAR